MPTMQKQHLLAEISNASAHGYPFYVYTLADAKGVFYVGKGRGDRIFHHERLSACDTNQAKKARILACGAGLQRAIVAYFNDAYDAYAFEGESIRAWPGLTNIALGDHLPPIERARQRAQEIMDRIVPFERWNPGPACRAFMETIGASTPREVYDRLKAELAREIDSPTPTTIMLDRHGKVTGYRYNETHGVWPPRKREVA